MEASASIIGTPPPLPRTSDSRLGILLASLPTVTALADFCIWREDPRLSIGLLAIGLAAVILLNRPKVRWTRRTICLLALIFAAAVESAFDLCFSNGLILVVLTFVLAGETFYDSLPYGWSRWSEALWAMMKTPGRWFWLVTETTRQMYHGSSSPWRGCGKVLRAIGIIAPGLLVTSIFGIVLAYGNAMFANLTANFATAVENWYLSLDLNFWHCAFWVIVAWISLPLLHPSPAPATVRFWATEMPTLPKPLAERTTRLQSFVMLALLNALFCCVNTLDAIYLWARQQLPANVSYSAFVHHGTGSIIIAVIFSAILLAGMFHQVRGVSSWKPLRLLGLLWIAQNLILLAGVLLRVKLYVDAYDLSVTRVNLVFFLSLVGIGFVLLAIRVWWRRPLGWLLNANMLTTFFLFYSVQFLDTQHFVADYNVKLWENSHQVRSLDLAYLKSLGPPAYDALAEVARSSSDPGTAAAARDYLLVERSAAQNTLSKIPWASRQWRAESYERRLAITAL